MRYCFTQRELKGHVLDSPSRHEYNLKMTVNLLFLILSKINLKHISMKITARVLHKTIETIKIWTPNMSYIGTNSIICVRDTSHCFTRDLVIIPDNRNAGTLVDW